MAAQKARRKSIMLTPFGKGKEIEDEEGRGEGGEERVDLANNGMIASLYKQIIKRSAENVSPFNTSSSLSFS